MHYLKMHNLKVLKLKNMKYLKLNFEILLLLMLDTKISDKSIILDVG